MRWEIDVGSDVDSEALELAEKRGAMKEKLETARTLRIMGYGDDIIAKAVRMPITTVQEWFDGLEG